MTVLSSQSQKPASTEDLRLILIQFHFHCPDRHGCTVLPECDCIGILPLRSSQRSPAMPSHLKHSLSHQHRLQRRYWASLLGLAAYIEIPLEFRALYLVNRCSAVAIAVFIAYSGFLLSLQLCIIMFLFLQCTINPTVNFSPIIISCVAEQHLLDISVNFWQRNSQGNIAVPFGAGCLISIHVLPRYKEANHLKKIVQG